MAASRASPYDHDGSDGACGREGKADWAAKYHIGLAPVYYFSYLLGELFASSIQEALQRACGHQRFNTPEMGRFLQERFFAPGNRWSWGELVRNVTGGLCLPAIG